MLFDRQRDVDRCQKGKDVSLQGGNEDLECHEGNARNKGEGAETDAEESAHPHVEVVGSHEAQHQDDVASDHVG